MRKATIFVFIFFIAIPGVFFYISLIGPAFSFGLLLPLALAGAYITGLTIRGLRK